MILINKLYCFLHAFFVISNWTFVVLRIIMCGGFESSSKILITFADSLCAVDYLE